MVGGIVLLLMLDGWTKFWVRNNLPHVAFSSASYPYSGIPLFRNLLGIEGSIVYATNTGVVWGLCSGHPTLLACIRAFLILGLLGFFLLKRPEWKQSLPLALILAGAVGNFFDLLFYGEVVDLFYFRFWGWSFPIFNLADSAICLGVGSWLLFSFFARQEVAPAS